HVRYAKRWLERVLHEFEPVADLVIAVQLDDDEGAYIDNQTWPAPHLAAYLRWLASVVHGVTGPAEPVFINTYDMKVTGSSPVWAMGNWYQSDTYSIGEHDRTQLELATGLLQTQHDKPVMVSEFQAGWLEQPDDIRPRAADPSNTELAIGTMIALGARGVVNFPAQDTLYPSGMEAPFANAFYAWDAALPLWTSALTNGGNPRFVPTQKMGDIVAAYGTHIASSHVLADAGIVYLADAFDSRHITNADIAGIAAQTAQTQRSCRALSLTCTLVDLRYTSEVALHNLPILIVPFLPVPTATTAQLTTAAQVRLKQYAQAGGIIVPLSHALGGGALPNTLVTSATTLSEGLVRLTLHAARHVRVVSFAPGASFAPTSDGSGLGFLTIPNYRTTNTQYDAITLHPSPHQRIVVHGVEVRAREVLIEPIAMRSGALITPPACRWCNVSVTSLLLPPGELLPIRRDQFLPMAPWQPLPPGKAKASLEDVYREGSDAAVLQNSGIGIVISPNAGARAFIFEDLKTGTSIFTTVGALRDDIQTEPPLSTVDKIAKYTHQFPAGMFNRPYTTTLVSDGDHATARFVYDAPDVVPHGAHFERTVSLAPDARAFTLDETVNFPGDGAAQQRAVSVTSLAVGTATTMTTATVLSPMPAPFSAQTTLVDASNVLGFYDSASHELATISWRPGDVENAQILERTYSIVVRLTLAPRLDDRTMYGYYSAGDLAAAQRLLGEVGRAARRGHVLTDEQPYKGGPS
ncbi:MAG TPA: hypothetical protein VGD50_00695, partial [Candidatus Baltobacteraceae bacterium]